MVAHYVTEAAAKQTSVGKWRYTPSTLTRWVSSINQFHTAAGFDAPGRAEVVRRARCRGAADQDDSKEPAGEEHHNPAGFGVTWHHPASR